MARNVVLAPAAVKDLDLLDAAPRAQVLADMTAFAANPTGTPPRLKQMRGFKPPLFRLRSGDYRVLFRFGGAEMHVYRIIDRKNLERALRRIT